MLQRIHLRIRLLVNAKFHDDNEKCSAIISLTERQLGVVAEHFYENNKAVTLTGDRSISSIGISPFKVKRLFSG